MPSEFDKPYNPKEHEDKIYKLWEESGFFAPEGAAELRGTKTQKNAETFTIALPPPNITGSLHMGHALNATIQDILIRKKRMEGYRALWIPGTDHAGIATQNIVEKELKKQGISRYNLGREKFLEKVWEWKEKYGNIILDQLKKMGASCDWTRARFTMDPEYQEAVKTAFLHYQKKGWIYRGERVISWCVRCQTSLSDLELEYQEEKGKLWFIKYPLAEEKNKFITLATTRPETMLGDTAVAVNPKDKRYKNLIGKKVILPIQNLEIQIVSDRRVEMDFGTGAVKITPAHDMLDEQIALTHKLPAIQVINEKGEMTKEAGREFEGLKILEAREKVVKKLEELSLIEKIEDYSHNVAKCYRCGSTIEPLKSMQWFLKMSELAEMAIKAVKSGKIKFHPKKWEKIYFDWLKNIRDWTISRQIWWGHKIPAWKCKGEIKIDKKMGFAGDVVPQVFIDKTKTYRLRDHKFQIGDIVAFENSQTRETFGYGKIIEIEKTTIGEINLQDPKHHKTYNNREELLKAFKRHPQKIDIESISEKTPAWMYTYSFTKEMKCEEIVVSTEKPKECPKCRNGKITPFTDVLDTWFSSALWPFAILGWPKDSADLKNYYPTQVLSTARDIINLWVARMVFSSEEFFGKTSFSDVIIHATILAKDGKRMSKSLGTGVDPMTLIEKYGADATRFGLIWQAMGGQDIHWSEEHVVAGKKFCNKIWNASRFVLRSSTLGVESPKTPSVFPRPPDKKILVQLRTTQKNVSKFIDKYDFGKALHILYEFFWHDFCDIYLEESKKNPNPEVLARVLKESLKFLHPFMPFITEHIWSKLPGVKNLLIIEEWTS